MKEALLMTVKIKQHYGGISMNENAIRKLADSDERLNIRLLNDFAFKTTFHKKAALTGLLSALLISIQPISGN